MMGADASSGLPQIGGPFSLVDQHGRTTTEKDFRGEFMLIYFGYTYSRNISPTSLETMTEAIKGLGAAGARVRPIFVTIDPQRDTVEQMQMYAKFFHPRLVALTGSKDQVAAAATAFRIDFARIEEEEASDYLMDHSSVIYLMGPDGRYLTRFTHDTGPQAITSSIRRFL